MRRYRRNADADLRKLERLAAAGDGQAQGRLRRARERLKPSPQMIAEKQAWDQLADHPKVKSFLLAVIRMTLGNFKQSGAENVLLSRDPVLDKAYSTMSGPHLDSVYDSVVDRVALKSSVFRAHPESHAYLQPVRWGYEVVVDVYVREVDEGEQDQIYYELESALEDRDEALKVDADAAGTQGEWDADMDYDSEGEELNITFRRPLELYHLATLGQLDIVPDEQKSKARRRRPRPRRNPDEGLRRHERAAAAGDPEALAAAARERRRAGEDVLSWELDPVGQVFHQAFLMGKEGRVEAMRKGGILGGRIERFYVSANRLPDRGDLSRGPMSPFQTSWAFYDWRPWVDEQGVVVVPQEPVMIDVWGSSLDTLYVIARRYNLTPDEVWDANKKSHVEWGVPYGSGAASVSGIHPYWTEGADGGGLGDAPPRFWNSGHYGAPVDVSHLSPAERWRFNNLYATWIRSGTVPAGHRRVPHWITVPVSGRWSVLFKTPRNAGRNDAFGDRGMQDANALRPSDYAWARIMTRKGKSWKNPGGGW